jgi:arabinogalactan oligomer/maltooligosaccharide transport system permease protein
MINKDGIKFKKLWRTVFVMTIAIPQFISLLSIGTLLKDSGAIGYWYFQTFGQRLGFGTDGSAGAVAITKIVIILVNVWIGIPYTILSTTGILLNIPKDLYESAKVDGTSTFTQFTKITMPYILFVTGPYLITQFIGNINNFNVIFFLTGGGPSLAGSGLLGLGQTDLLITFIYKVVTSTSNPQYGIASAIGIIVFIICSFISIVMYNKSGSIKEEDQFQ